MQHPIKTFSMLLCLAFLSACAARPPLAEEGRFEAQYRSYQHEVKAGTTALNKQDHIAAIDHFSRAIEAAPFEADHYFQRALAWFRKGNDAAALLDLNRVLMMNPKHYRATLYRGLARMNRKEYREALSDYQDALTQGGEDASLHNNLAWLYATAEDPLFQDKAKALEHGLKAAELSKEGNAEILDTLARAYGVNGKTEAAVKTLQKAIKLAPANEALKAHLRAYEKKKDE